MMAIDAIPLTELVYLAENYEKQYPYHRNHPGEEAELAKHFSEIISLIDQFKDGNALVDQIENQKVLGCLIKLVRRCSEYKLSRERDYHFAFNYSEWAMHQSEKSFAGALPDFLLEDSIKMTQHLGFAYYFARETKPEGEDYLIKARRLLLRSLEINQGRFPDLMGYSYCILGQIATLNGGLNEARNYLSKAYLLYATQSEEGEFDQKRALEDLDAVTLLLDQESGMEKRSSLYQRAIVIGYFADNEVRAQAYDFAEKCCCRCAAFVQKFWKEDTLQVGDIYFRLGNLMKVQKKTIEAAEWYQKSLSVYQNISPNHERITELSQLIQPAEKPYS